MVQLENGNGLSITVLPYGASWASCKVALPNATVREILLGCDSLLEYRAQRAYLGACIGRYSNRLSNAHFSIKGIEYGLDTNDGAHCLHGGSQGFGVRNWSIELLTGSSVSLSIVSADGEGGFPGRMMAQVTYKVLQDQSVVVDFLASVDQACPVSLTNHAYFNLDGDAMDCRNHWLQLASACYLPITVEGIPAGEIRDAQHSPFDFRSPKSIGFDFSADLQLLLNKGYNHAFLLDHECAQLTIPAAILSSSDRMLSMQIYTTQPAVHIYTGNYLAGVTGRNASVYRDYAGIALETENLPDAPNHPEWSSNNAILAPGSIYRQRTCYKFVAHG